MGEQFPTAPFRESCSCLRSNREIVQPVEMMSEMEGDSVPDLSSENANNKSQVFRVVPCWLHCPSGFSSDVFQILQTGGYLEGKDLKEMCRYVCCLFPL